MTNTSNDKNYKIWLMSTFITIHGLHRQTIRKWDVSGHKRSNNGRWWGKTREGFKMKEIVKKNVISLTEWGCHHLAAPPSDHILTRLLTMDMSSRHILIFSSICWQNFTYPDISCILWKILTHSDISLHILTHPEDWRTFSKHTMKLYFI